MHACDILIPMNQINYQKKLDETLSNEDTKSKSLLLQCCCAPCSSHCLTYIEGKINITAYYYNPNIAERDEYDKRAAELKRLVGILNSEFPDANIEFKEGPFEPEKFFLVSKGLENEPERGARCAKCFELRLKETAKKAKAEGFDYIATTLTLSPLKDARLINEIGERVAKEEGVLWLYSDFKKQEGYKHSVELSNKYGLYRQNYCGCPFSKRGKNEEVT